jgi:dipeptidyl aminopeptidase/acylaminoacyl peptidase
MNELELADVLDVEYPGEPSWSTDGRLVAAPVYEDDDESLLVADVAGGDGDRGEDGDGDGDDDGERDAETPRRRLRPGGAGVVDHAWRPGTTELLVVTTDDETWLVDAARLLAGDAGDAAVAGDAEGAPTADSSADGVDDASGVGRRLAAGPESGHAFAPGGDRVACYRDGTPTVVDVATGEAVVVDGPGRGPYLGEAWQFAWDPGPEDRLAYRFVEDGAKQVGVADAGSGALVWRTTGPAADHTPAWLGDGRLLHLRVADARRRRSLLARDLAGGDATALVEEFDERGVASRGPPRVSPDGERVALALSVDGHDHVYVVDGAGERRRLTSGAFEDKGLADSAPRWIDDDALLVSSNRRAAEERHLFRIDVASGDVAPVAVTQGSNVLARPAPGGDRVAYVHADRDRSPELRVRPLDPDAVADASGRRLTTSVVDDWPVAPVDPERVVVSTDGFEVPGFLLDPRGSVPGVPADAEGLPAVVWVHGGPMRQMRDGWHPGRAYGLAYTVQQYLATRGVVGLLVNYRGGIGYGRAFRQAIADGDPGEEMADVVAAGEFLADLPYVDPDGVGVWGLSYGGYATLYCLADAPGTFACGVNLAGVADRRAYEEWATRTKYSPAESSLPSTLGGSPWDAPAAWDAASPLTFIEGISDPLYCFHGTGDRYVDVGQQELVVDRLLDTDATFEAEFYPDENHVFSRRAVWERTLRRTTTAFETHLGVGVEDDGA